MYQKYHYMLLLTVSLWGSLAFSQELWSLERPLVDQEPWVLQVALNNDALTSNEVDDDFYTFSLRMEARIGEFAYRLEENAFTDRANGLRFDETYFTIGGLLSDGASNGWQLWFEGGVAHVGEGLLGEGAQNAVHTVIGSERVHLRYIESDLYRLHFSTELGRQWRLNDEWSWGPIVSLSWTDNVRWNSVTGVRTMWRMNKYIKSDLIVGARYSETEIDLLEPHLKSWSVATQVNLNLPLGLFVEWSLNRYGTRRQHLSFGYRLGSNRESINQRSWDLEAINYRTWDLAYSTP